MGCSGSSAPYVPSRKVVFVVFDPEDIIGMAQRQHRDNMSTISRLIATVSILASLNCSVLPARAEDVPLQKRSAYKVIYNQDWISFFSYTKEPMTPAHVDRMVDEVADGGADLMLINVNGQRVNYPSRVWQTHYTTHQQMKRLVDQGCDYLARALARCRQASIAPGVSVRMNDSHGTYKSGRHPWVSDFYRDHPQWRLKTKFRRKNQLFMHTFDYRQPEVREHYLALIRELITGYRFDVLELDFLRHPPYFPLGSSEKHRAIMTDFIQTISKLLKSSKGKKKLLVRVPDAAATSYDLGLDVKRWTREGLIDGVTASGFCHTSWQMNVDEFRRLIGEKVTFYAGVEYTASNPERFPLSDYEKRDPARFMSLDERKLRGFAAAYYASGADGVYLFNFFVPRSRQLFRDHETKFEVLRELRDPDKLRGKPKTYTLTAGGKDWKYQGVDGPDQVPCVAEAALPRVFSMLMASEPESRQVEVEVFVEGEPGNRLKDLRLHINEFSAGHAIKIQPVADEFLADKPQDENSSRNIKPVNKILFRAKSKMLLDGRNRLTFHSDSVPLIVLAIEVRVN